ncbi:hypothetical protein K440DRAFT_670383 [Wilcoxina mikolae CBS 423.85]|nr:hypothetical protein K440DRAFT_670383 [Wilcoxina mikolae CBS 423.85]
MPNGRNTGHSGARGRGGRNNNPRGGRNNNPRSGGNRNHSAQTTAMATPPATPRMPLGPTTNQQSHRNQNRRIENRNSPSTPYLQTGPTAASANMFAALDEDRVEAGVIRQYNPDQVSSLIGTSSSAGSQSERHSDSDSDKQSSSPGTSPELSPVTKAFRHATKDMIPRNAGQGVIIAFGPKGFPVAIAAQTAKDQRIKDWTYEVWLRELVEVVRKCFGIANLGTNASNLFRLSPTEFDEWVIHCNSPNLKKMVGTAKDSLFEVLKMGTPLSYDTLSIMAHHVTVGQMSDALEWLKAKRGEEPDYTCRLEAFLWCLNVKSVTEIPAGILDEKLKEYAKQQNIKRRGRIQFFDEAKIYIEKLAKEKMEEGAKKGWYASHAEHEATKQEVQNLKQQSGNLKKANEGLTTRVEDLKKANEGLGTKVEDLKQANEGLTTRVEDLKTANEGLKKANEGLSTKVEDLKKANEGLKKANEGLSAKVEDLKKANEGLKKANEGLTTRVEDLKKANEGLGTKVEDLKQANEGLTTRVEDLKKANEGLKKANEGLTTKVEALERKFVAQEEENIGLKHRLEAIEAFMAKK